MKMLVPVIRVCARVGSLLLPTADHASPPPLSTTAATAAPSGRATTTPVLYTHALLGGPSQLRMEPTYSWWACEMAARGLGALVLRLPAALPAQRDANIHPTGEFAQFLRHLWVCHPGGQLLVIHDRGNSITWLPARLGSKRPRDDLRFRPSPPIRRS